MRDKRTKVLIVGQIPPPIGGQAVMIESLIKGHYSDVQLFHVRMAFSKEMNKIGKFRISKIFHLLHVIAEIIYVRLRHNVGILYYPPAGPDRIPMYRDVVILISTRWLFKKTIFHFFASGVSELYPKLAPIARFLFRVAYFNADAGIRLSEFTPSDGKMLKVKKEYIIPCGIEDHYRKPKRGKTFKTLAPNLLFEGALKESKGVLVLLEACDILAKRGIDFTLELMGIFESTQFEGVVKRRVAEMFLESHIRFLGIRTGKEKFGIFSEADIFCFPTFFESEAFPIALLDAMQFGIPIVATRWRGIPSLIEDSISGYLVPVKDGKAVAEKLEFLIKNPTIAKQMGQKGREVFLEKFTIDTYRSSLEKIFLSVGTLC